MLLETKVSGNVPFYRYKIDTLNRMMITVANIFLQNPIIHETKTDRIDQERLGMKEVILPLSPQKWKES